jgi:hypothetical protein
MITTDANAMQRSDKEPWEEAIAEEMDIDRLDLEELKTLAKNLVKEIK